MFSYNDMSSLVVYEYFEKFDRLRKLKVPITIIVAAAEDGAISCQLHEIIAVLPVHSSIIDVPSIQTASRSWSHDHC